MPKFQQVVSGYIFQHEPRYRSSNGQRRHAEKSIRQDGKKEIARQMGDPSLNRRKHAPRREPNKMIVLTPQNIRFTVNGLPWIYKCPTTGKWLIVSGNRRIQAANAILNGE